MEAGTRGNRSRMGGASTQGPTIRGHPSAEIITPKSLPETDTKKPLRVLVLFALQRIFPAAEAPIGARLNGREDNEARRLIHCEVLRLRRDRADGRIR